MKINPGKRFSTLYIENKPSWTREKSIWKTHRIPISPNGLVHGFCQKFEVFLPFRFMQKTSRKSVWWRFGKKQACLDNRNMDFKKRQPWHFLKGIVHDLVKKLILFSLSFLSKIDQGKVFVDALDRKKPSKTRRTDLHEKRKIRIFPRG